jgi:hypothetical protein
MCGSQNAVVAADFSVCGFKIKNEIKNKNFKQSRGKKLKME